MQRPFRSERGQSMAWTAVVMAFLIVPLLTLVVDGARLLYVQTRLQTAADAACEDAAWSAADRRAFRDEGITTFENNPLWLAQAQNTFNQTLRDQTGKNFAAVLVVTPDPAIGWMYCHAVASVPLVTTGGLLWSPVSIEIDSAAKIRFATP